MGAHQSIGYKALLLFGRDEQKKKYLPRLACGRADRVLLPDGAGKRIGCGFDQNHAPTLSPDGKHYIINGNKLWITNGGIATFMTVFAKTEVEEEGEKKEKVTCFALELPAKA